jgi:hypothetical protein
VIHVEHVIGQATEINDEGFYVCNATNDSGSTVAEIYLDVLGQSNNADR